MLTQAEQFEQFGQTISEKKSAKAFPVFFQQLSNNLLKETRETPQNIMQRRSRSVSAVNSPRELFDIVQLSHQQNHKVTFAQSPNSNKSSASSRIIKDINTLLNDSDQDNSTGKFATYMNQALNPTSNAQHKSSFFKLSEENKKKQLTQGTDENIDSCSTQTKTQIQINKNCKSSNDFLKYVMKKTLYSQQQDYQIEKDQYEKQEQYFRLDFHDYQQSGSANSRPEDPQTCDNQIQGFNSSPTIDYYQNQQQIQMLPQTIQYNKFQLQQQLPSNQSIGPPSLINISEFEEQIDSQYSQNSQLQQLSSSQFSQIIQNQTQQNQPPPYMNAAQFAQDQQGCRLLQKYLDKNDSIILKILFDQLIPIVPTLMTDQYGNYLCQKLAETCTPQQFLQILQVIKPTIIQISLHLHGTRAVQKIIDIFCNIYSPYKQQIISMKSGNKIQVVQILENVNYNIAPKELSFYSLMLRELTEGLGQDILSLTQVDNLSLQIYVKDTNGNHVLQKCLTSLCFAEKQFILDGIMLECQKIAMHKYGFLKQNYEIYFCQDAVFCKDALIMETQHKKKNQFQQLY